MSQPNQIDALEEDYLYISTSQIPNTGNGLRTAITIYKDEIIAVFKGEVLTQRQSLERKNAGNDRYFVKRLDGKILDSMHTDCFAKYANDALNSAFKNNAQIALDEAGRICLISKRKINIGEEIFCSYGKAYWLLHNASLQSINLIEV